MGSGEPVVRLTGVTKRFGEDIVAVDALLGAAAVVLVPRALSVARLLGGYSALVYCFLFAPILVVVV
jgi:hypothetical protein